MLLVWSENARDERLAHIEYLAKTDIEYARHIDAKLEAATESLLIFPEKAPKGRITGTRDLFVSPRYRLIYKIKDNSVVILSVLHTSQQYPEILPDI